MNVVVLRGSSFPVSIRPVTTEGEDRLALPGAAEWTIDGDALCIALTVQSSGRFATVRALAAGMVDVVVISEGAEVARLTVEVADIEPDSFNLSIGTQ
jgi:hypothetical protein